MNQIFSSQINEKPVFKWFFSIFLYSCIRNDAKHFLCKIRNDAKHFLCKEMKHSATGLQVSYAIKGLIKCWSLWLLYFSLLFRRRNFLRTILKFHQQHLIKLSSFQQEKKTNVCDSSCYFTSFSHLVSRNANNPHISHRCYKTRVFKIMLWVFDKYNPCVLMSFIETNHERKVIKQLFNRY